MTSPRHNLVTGESGTALAFWQEEPAGKAWRDKDNDLPKYARRDLYEVYSFLGKQARKRLGLVMSVPVFITDPLVALENPLLGVQEIEVRLENDFGEGPTSSRIAVVDFNADSQSLTKPVGWDRNVGWFYLPQVDGQSLDAKKRWLPDAPKPLPKRKNLTEKKRRRYQESFRQFIEETVGNLHFHQVNTWAIVQRVLEFYEAPQALGRPIPWGFDGNRLIVVPHAGYGENAFYDRQSKSLQFYYFGDAEQPIFTCLSHDIITHETGHAILDGIRPLYNHLSSRQTGAFHEFMGDLTAILLALFNTDIRHYLAERTKGDMSKADVVAHLAKQFGLAVEGRPYLRSATNELTMRDVEGLLSPHTISQVLTGAMFDILIQIAKLYMGEPPVDEERASRRNGAEGQTTPAQALWWSVDRFRRVALQPLDLCPPCDIQFIDYAKAVLRNDLLTNPVDLEGYRQIMLDVFHQRGLCTCAYETGKDLPEDCLFCEVFDRSSCRPKIDLVFHDIERISSSRTAAYYFLSDNRRALRIPSHQDIQVVDLYDSVKLGAAAERLPRAVVLEYLWEEEVLLENDPEKVLEFGQYQGTVVSLLCGGTLVFDGRGNLLSWMRKPGTEHIQPEEAQALRQRLSELESRPEGTRPRGPTKQQLGELQDLEEGKRRKAALLHYISRMIEKGLIGLTEPGAALVEGMKPVAAMERDGELQLEVVPQLRRRDFDSEVETWTTSY